MINKSDSLFNSDSVVCERNTLLLNADASIRLGRVYTEKYTQKSIQREVHREVHREVYTEKYAKRSTQRSTQRSIHREAQCHICVYDSEEGH